MHLQTPDCTYVEGENMSERPSSRLSGLPAAHGNAFAVLHISEAAAGLHCVNGQLDASMDWTAHFSETGA
jgi:hypothetical protein